MTRLKTEEIATDRRPLEKGRQSAIEVLEERLGTEALGRELRK